MLVARIWEYLLAAGVYWWATLAVILGIERVTERAFPNFWKSKVDPWFTSKRRKQFLIAFALLAFAIGNFRAWDEERAEKEKAIADRLTSSPRDPNFLYQGDFQVATIIEPTVDVTNNSIVFPAVTASRELNLSADFEFKDWRLACSGQPGSMMTFGAMREITYQNFRCKIEGTRS